MLCRVGCGACCIAPSISSSIPGMLEGKPAGERCAHLSDDNTCRLFGDESRPKVCSDFIASIDTCGKSFAEAMEKINWLEQKTGD